MRIPLAVRWPRRAAAGSSTAALVSNLDIVASIRDLVGASTNSGDGTSLLPLLQAPDAVAWREDLMLESHGHYRQWVFQRMLRWRNWKYVASLDDRDELYDLQADPYELQNRVDDPTLEELRREMRARLLRQMERPDDSAPDARRLRARFMAPA